MVSAATYRITLYNPSLTDSTKNKNICRADRHLKVSPHFAGKLHTGTGTGTGSALLKVSATNGIEIFCLKISVSEYQLASIVPCAPKQQIDKVLFL